MSAVPKIKNLDELLKDCVGGGRKIKDAEITRLTAPGENYGSLMLKVDITLQNRDGTTEPLYAVAKLIPELEFFRKAFQIQQTVKTEIAFYNVVIPTLQDFQREHGITKVIDCFPTMYNSRLNLKESSDEVDEDAVLLFENLCAKGFRNINRRVGFNLEETKCVLKDLAALHAIPLALKLQKPNIFKEKVERYFHKFCPPSPPPGDKPHHDDLLLEICKSFNECEPYIPAVERKVKVFQENHRKAFEKPPPSEPWGTLCHGDMWVNNTMQRFEEGKIVENKFVDFQMYYYDTPVRDLQFFLWTSCQLQVLQEHLEDLLKFYHEHFTKTLKDLGCNTTPFTYEKFILEVEKVACSVMFNAIFFSLFVVFGKKELKEVTDKPPAADLKKDEVDPNLIEKICFAVCYHGKKNLLE